MDGMYHDIDEDIFFAVLQKGGLGSVKKEVAGWAEGVWGGQILKGKA